MSADTLQSAAADPWSLYDDPARQSQWVVITGRDRAEVQLSVAGVHCGACVATIKDRLRTIPGVHELDIQLPGERARLSWDPARQKLGAILAAIAALGYRAAPVDALAAAAARRREARTALLRLFVAGFSMMQVMMYAVPVYVTDDGIAVEHAALLQWASLVLTVPVVFYSALPFFSGAWRDLRNRRPGMDVPVAIGIGAAFIASAWATIAGQGEVYFDSVTMFVFLLLASRYFELRARQKAASAADRLARQLPELAERIVDNDGIVRFETVPAAALRPGDCVVVKPGEPVPADGRVLIGHATLEEGVVTGESAPVSRSEGAPVLAGSTLYAAEPDGRLLMAVEAAGEETRLAEMVRLLDRALADKPRLGQLADRVAGWFTGALLVLALLTALAWWFVDPARIVAVTIAVLVVSCPCALSLATPCALAAATGVLAQRGLLVLRGRGLETLAGATHVVFDKTGTLTSGRVTLQDTIALGALPTAAALDIAGALEAGSQHPVGQALRAAASMPKAATGVTRTAGSGVEGMVDGRRYRLGRPSYVAELVGQRLPAELELERVRDEQTTVALADSAGWIAVFLLADAARPGARKLVAQLRARGLAVMLLSGDRPQTVRHWAGRLGIDDAEGGASPQRKRDVIAALQERGAIVAMIGDGANDSAALGIAHVSIAMGNGARLAQIGADMVWLGDNLDQLDWAMRKSRTAIAIIRQNLLWAFCYNLIAIPLAVAGFIGPWMAGLGMSASSMLVVLNSLRLLRDSGAAPDTAPRPATTTATLDNGASA